MTNKKVFEIEFTNGKSIRLDVVEFGFPANLFFYMKYKGELIDKKKSGEFGSYLVEERWVRLDEIKSLRCENISMFSNLEERQQFVKGMMQVG